MLATHNPTIKVLFKTVRIEIQAAFFIAMASLLLFKWQSILSEPDNSLFHTIKDIWEKICYSIVASTVFYFINQHIPKVEKRVSVYHFETNTVKKLIMEIKELLERPDGDKIDAKRGTNPEAIYASLDHSATNQPPKTEEDDYDYTNWAEYLEYKSDLMSDLVQLMLPLHDALERTTLEYLFKVEDGCYRIKKRLEENSNFLQVHTHTFTDLMYCMVGLSELVEKKYKHTKAIIEYRDKVQELKDPFPYAFDYKLKYRGEEAPVLKINEGFILNFLNFLNLIILIIVAVRMVAAFS